MRRKPASAVGGWKMALGGPFREAKVGRNVWNLNKKWSADLEVGLGG